ncbi:MAG TPA: DUF1398 family protein [Mucilaginibacter sp.]|nr:DUF1398 family protein [Mucilaginibacter sp.]
MFTVQQIKAVHATVKSGADFPRYVQEIKALGLVRYEFLVEDGRTVYYGNDNYSVEAPAIYPAKLINPVPLTAQMEHNIREHQAGKSDFLTICAQAAAAGVHHWEVNAYTMLCSYYDVNGNRMIAEPIPQGDYITKE